VKQLAARAAELRRLLEREPGYYALDRPEISDAEYDHLFRVQDLETAHPKLRTPDSPPPHRRRPRAAFRKHRHLVPMLSLANAFNEAELTEWEERNARLVADVKRRATRWR
jgi:DNA ligase (NAD+)